MRERERERERKDTCYKKKQKILKKNLSLSVSHSPSHSPSRSLSRSPSHSLSRSLSHQWLYAKQFLQWSEVTVCVTAMMDSSGGCVMCACVCVCVCVRARVCMCVCVKSDAQSSGLGLRATHNNSVTCVRPAPLYVLYTVGCCSGRSGGWCCGGTFSWVRVDLGAKPVFLEGPEDWIIIGSIN